MSNNWMKMMPSGPIKSCSGKTLHASNMPFQPFTWGALSAVELCLLVIGHRDGTGQTQSTVRSQDNEVCDSVRRLGIPSSLLMRRTSLVFGKGRLTISMPAEATPCTPLSKALLASRRAAGRVCRPDVLTMSVYLTLSPAVSNCSK